MSETLNLEEITAIIENEKNATQSFLEILKKEEEALTQGQVNELDKLVSEKTKLFNQIEAISGRRLQYLLVQGYPSNREGMQRWLIDHSDCVETQKLWHQLIDLAKQVQQINAINGKVIAIQLQYNQRSYLALQSAAGNISLYGPKGQAYI
ncbi:MAG: flagellar protein FlgN [Nitrosomonas sp.]|nr:flagellar protein FlgN [Nitrosomonas sp.]